MCNSVCDVVCDVSGVVCDGVTGAVDIGLVECLIICCFGVLQTD